MWKFENRLNKGCNRDPKAIGEMQGCNIQSRRLNSRFGIEGWEWGL